MGADVKDFEPGGGIPEGIGSLLQSGSAGGDSFKGIDVVPETPYGIGPEQLSVQGRTTAHREEAEVTGGGELGLSSAGGSTGVNRFQEDWVIRHEYSE